MKNVSMAMTIAGSDCSGGAGVQADIKTMSALGVFASSCITALTCQNTMGVTDIMAVKDTIVRGQIDAVLSDLPIKSVKIGMLFNNKNFTVDFDFIAVGIHMEFRIVHPNSIDQDFFIADDFFYFLSGSKSTVC